jgi:hypothetical protein
MRRARLTLGLGAPQHLAIYLAKSAIRTVTSTATQVPHRMPSSSWWLACHMSFWHCSHGAPTRTAWRPSDWCFSWVALGLLGAAIYLVETSLSSTAGLGSLWAGDRRVDLPRSRFGVRRAGAEPFGCYATSPDRPIQSNRSGRDSSPSVLDGPIHPARVLGINAVVTSRNPESIRAAVRDRRGRPKANGCRRSVVEGFALQGFPRGRLSGTFAQGRGRLHRHAQRFLNRVSEVRFLPGAPSVVSSKRRTGSSTGAGGRGATASPAGLLQRARVRGHAAPVHAPRYDCFA